jgi:2,5-dioxopentanoate dehydrogenase
MIKGVNLIGFEESRNGKEFIQAYNPRMGKTLPEEFHIAEDSDIDNAVKKSVQAFEEFKNVSGSRKADFLESIGEEILNLGDQLITRAMDETGLPSGRLQGERGRTVNQLNMFAGLLREGSWVDARIDKAQPDRTPIPKSDIRYMNFPIGPVAVFGASNFPLAFSTAGGDTASALAAGCPVIIKSHESHPGTNELVSRAILKAAEKTGMPDGVFSSLNGGAEIGQKLVKHSGVKAIGFTGSYKGGKAIFDLAQQRDEPIPVYAEMGSVNPVFLLNEKLKESADELALQYAGSVTLGVGQFCTNPGLLIGVDSDELNQFRDKLARELQIIESECMLNPGIARNYKKKRDEFFSHKHVEVYLKPESESDTFGAPGLATVEAENFINDPKLHEEVFGPFTLIVKCKNKQELSEVAKKLEGQLTITFAGTHEELPEYSQLVSIAREKAGRIIFNGVPTGVEVCPSMQHGGPFPATTDSKFTSVGTAAIKRFVRPVAFQDCPEALLPDELKNDNPLGIYRLLDGELKK